MGQLVLTRRESEEVIIRVPTHPAAVPLVIRVKVAQIRDDRVRLAFNAPIEVSIDRPEIDASKQAENRS